MSSPILSIRGATISFAKKLLFENLSLNLFLGDRVCLIGKNGAGKSSLMNAIFGRIDFDEGERWIMPGARLGYLEQNEKMPPNLTIEQYILQEIALDDHKSYLIDMICDKLKLNKFALTHNLSGGEKRRANLAKILVLEPEILLLDEPTNHLDLNIIQWLEEYLQSFKGALLVISHDRKFLEKVSNKVFWLRAGSIKINHLGYKNFDEWSQSIIDHENRELTNLQKKFELESGWLQTGVTARRKRNVGRLHYLEELRQKMRKQKQIVSANESRIKIHEQEKFDEDAPDVIASFNNVSKSFGLDGFDVDCFASLAMTGKGDAMTGGGDAMTGGGDAMTDGGDAMTDGGNAMTNGGSIKTILKNFSLKILRGEKIGIIGANGSGKSTFLKLLIGDEKPNQGTVKLARDLQFSYFDQDRAILQNTEAQNQSGSQSQKKSTPKTIKDILCETGSDYVHLANDKTMHICGYLQNFLFEAKDTETLVSTLSGGQQNRLLLAKVLANPKNFLILDEPTNDLDMDSLDILQNYLDKYQGTVLIVSHDRDFLDETATSILAFEGDGKITSHIGGYSDYENYVAKYGKNETKDNYNIFSGVCQAKSTQKATNPQNEQNLSKNDENQAKIAQKPQINRSKLKNEADKIAIKIEKIEQKILDLNDELINTDDRNPANLAQISIEISKFQAEIEALEDRWVEVEILINS